MWLLGAYFLFQVVVRLCLPWNLEIDEGEQLIVSQWFGVGYDTQPPFYNWIQHTVNLVFGQTVLSLAVNKNILLFTFYFFYWRLSRMLLKNSDLAIIATLGLFSIPQVSFEAQRDLTHTVALIFSATFFLYWFVRTLKQPSTLTYVMTGVAIGIGMISKYNFALLPIAGTVSILFDPRMRLRLWDWRILLTAVFALLIFLPHGLWLLNNLELASRGTLAKMTDGSGQVHFFGQIPTGLLSFASALIGFSTICIVLLYLLFGKRLPASFKTGDEWTRLFERMFLVIALVLIGLILFAHTEQIKDRWLTSFLIALPLYICMKIERSGVDVSDTLRRFLPIPLAAMVIIPTILLVRFYVAGPFGVYGKLHVPYQQFVQQVTKEATPSYVVTVEPHLGGNIRLNLPTIPVDTLNYPGFVPQYSWDAQHPVLLAWRDNGQPNMPMPTKIEDWLRARDIPKESLVIKDTAFPYISGHTGDLYHFMYAWVYPK